MKEHAPDPPLIVVDRQTSATQKHANAASIAGRCNIEPRGTIKAGLSPKALALVTTHVVFDALNTGTNSSRSQRAKNMSNQLATVEGYGSAKIHRWPDDMTGLLRPGRESLRARIFLI